MDRCNIFRRRKISTVDVDLRNRKEEPTQTMPQHEIQLPSLLTDEMMSMPRRLPDNIFRRNRAGLEEASQGDFRHPLTPPPRRTGRVSAPCPRTETLPAPPTMARAATAAHEVPELSNSLREMLQHGIVGVGTLLDGNNECENADVAPSVSETSIRPTEEVLLTSDANLTRRQAFARKISELTLSQDLLEDTTFSMESLQETADATEEQEQQPMYVDGFSTEDYIDDEQFDLLLAELENEYKEEQAINAASFVFRGDQRQHSQVSTYSQDDEDDDNDNDDDTNLIQLIQTLESTAADDGKPGSFSGQPGFAREEYNRILVEQYQVLKEITKPEKGDDQASPSSPSRAFREIRRTPSRGCSILESSLSTHSRQH